MRPTKSYLHSFYLGACGITLIVLSVLSYTVPWPLNFALVFVPAVALLTYIFWPEFK